MSSTSQLTDFSDLTTIPSGRSAHIYGLCDPTTGQIRYVGKSINPTIRRYEHICASQLRRKSHKNHWIKSLLVRGEKPEMFVIETVPESEWANTERFWIAYFKFVGADLTNSTDGGEGDCSPEGHKKQADALRGRKVVRSSGHLAKIVQANKDRATNPIWLAKIKIAASARAKREKPELMDRLKVAWFAPRTKRYQNVCIGCGLYFVAKNTRKKYCRPQCCVNTWKRNDRKARSNNVVY